MERYKEVGGITNEFSYLHALDDFFAQAMLNGYKSYFTQETLAYHPLERDKPENSLTKVDSIDLLDDCKRFYDKWSDNEVWTYNFLHDHVSESSSEGDLE